MGGGGWLGGGGGGGKMPRVGGKIPRVILPPGQDTPGYLAPGGQAARVLWGWGKINCYTGYLT